MTNRKSIPTPGGQDNSRARRSFLRRFLGLFAGIGAGGAGAASATSVPAESGAPAPGLASADPFIGEIIIFAGNFAPRGWALCDGQMLAISGNEALFSILGTTYGGDGRTTFGLPDLRGRVPIHAGGGPGLSLRQLGASGGSEQTTLSQSQMPQHSHAVSASSIDGVADTPESRIPARPASGIPQYGTTADTAMASNTVQPAGAGQPHDNMQPFLAVNYIIALVGTFPSRS